MIGLRHKEFYCPKCGITWSVPYCMHFKSIPKDKQEEVMSLELTYSAISLRNSSSDVDYLAKLNAKIEELAYEDVEPEIDFKCDCGVKNASKV